MFGDKTGFPLLRVSQMTLIGAKHLGSSIVVYRRKVGRLLTGLLEYVMEAHGGLARWQQFTDIVTDIDLRGRLCEENGWTGMVPNSRLLLSLREQRSIILLPRGQGSILVRPELVSYSDASGTLRSALERPHEMLLQEQGMDWDILRTAYFITHAIRHSITAPFLYTLPGFVAEEVEPWQEADELWYVLRVTFPLEFGSPTQTHLAYYGPDGRLRRTRNGAKMIGGMDLVEYVASYDRIDGILLPTAKDVFACDTFGRRYGGPRLGRFEFNGLFLAN